MMRATVNADLGFPPPGCPECMASPVAENDDGTIHCMSCGRTERLPWEVLVVSVDDDYIGVRFEGVNHYAREGEYGRRFSWALDALSFRDLAFTARRYDFARAQFMAGARERLAKTLERASVL